MGDLFIFHLSFIIWHLSFTRIAMTNEKCQMNNGKSYKTYVSARAVSTWIMQMNVLFGRHLNMAKAVADCRAAIGYQPLKSKGFVELSQIRIKRYKVGPGYERFAAGFVPEPDQRTLAEVYFHSKFAR